VAVVVGVSWEIAAAHVRVMRVKKGGVLKTWLPTMRLNFSIPPG
jgi:hypothetical protein